MSSDQTQHARGVFYYHVELEDEFPIRGGIPGVQLDKPINALHWHESLEIGICVEGAGVFVVGEKVLPFAAGDVTVIGPTEVHMAQSLPGTTSLWYWIYLDPLRLMPHSSIDAGVLLDSTSFSGPAFENVIRPAEDSAVGDIVRLIVDELKEPRSGQLASIVSLTTHLFIRVRRLRANAEGTDPEDRRVGFDRIAPAIAIIARDFASELTVPELARACRVSEPTLRRLFLSTVSQTPRDYWLGLRLRMAASMLRGTSLTVIEVSRTVGFSTLSIFNRLFLRQYGHTPTEWRSRGKSTASSDRKQSDIGQIHVDQVTIDA